MTDWSEYQDDISDAISDSMDMDWSANDGARAVVRWLNENKPLSAAPAPEGGAVTHRQASDHAANSDDPLATMLRDVDDRLNRDNPDIPGARVSLHGARLAASYRALATREEALAEAGEIDLYDDKVQAGIAWTMRQWGETLGLKTWDMGDGSESVEGDVGAEIHTILVDAGLRDPETNEMAALRAQPPAREDAQPVAWRVTNKATGHDELFWKPLADLPFNRERFSTEPLYTHPAPDALEQIDPATVETAIGGAYDMPDGRKFWIDAPVAREMTNRVLAALQAEQGAK